MSLTQKALFIESKHGPFKVSERDIPTPGPGQLLVRIEAVGLNPVDWKIQKYGFIVETYPAIIGSEIAGVVERVADGVEGFAREADSAAKIPSHLSFEEAATIPATLATAFVGLYLPLPHGVGLVPPLETANRGKYSRKSLVVIGGATSVGQFVIQLAKLSGFSCIIATASLKHSEYLRSIGATHVLDRNLDKAALAAEVSKITSNPIEIVFDTVSLPKTQEIGYSLLSPGGNIALLLPASFTPIKGKNIVNVMGFFTPPYSRELGLQFYKKLEELLDAGLIKPLRFEVVPGGLNAVVDGLERLQADKVSGVKLVVRPHETI
ncbi:hypothetical protein H0H81_002487 [Sphagnurus paluster]|uniref:Enoyl reductase (ER) domain-containing protein n=1 Tax=Sphagnurus paluster TaxID=117069 RepID=A0A9P7FTB2_9AGAR|nr:hypothetical protein H0H81_002487 [Sphagnurus paluster]